jgi:hypothetical protein
MYPTLFEMNASALNGRGGVYLIWHLGVRPQWLCVGQSADLAKSFATLAKAPDIVLFRANGGVFAAWSFMDPERRPGVVRYLSELLKPSLQGSAMAPANVTPIPIALPPGTQEFATTP